MVRGEGRRLRRWWIYCPIYSDAIRPVGVYDDETKLKEVNLCRVPNIYLSLLLLLSPLFLLFLLFLLSLLFLPFLLSLLFLLFSNFSHMFPCILLFLFAVEGGLCCGIIGVRNKQYLLEYF